jgi:predicted dehydrogenase
MTDRLRAGIIGTGFIGAVHANAVRAAGGVVSRVAAASPESSADAAVRLGADRAAGSAEELIAADDVDVVHICTPNHLHTSLATLAIQAKKPVICEKPLATTLLDAHTLTDAAAEAGIVTAVPFVYRFYPTVREARARIGAGQAGPIRLMHGSYLQDWLADGADTNWRVDPALGGSSRAFGDIGVHWCDLMEFTTGHRIRRLAARLVTTHDHRATEDAATALFETDQGAHGSIMISQVTPGRKNRLWFSFDGVDASFAFDQERPDTLWVGGRSTNQEVLRDPATLSPAARAYSVLPAGHPQGYQDCFNAFVADAYAVIDGQVRDGLPTFADGLRAAAITAAVIESAATEQWVDVPSARR